MEQPPGQILVGASGEKVVIRPQGRATHVHAPHLREFAAEVIARGSSRFELDLGLCTYMDSTFLGVLVGLSQRLENEGLGQVSVTRIGPRNAELFRTLGVERFFRMENPGAALAAPVAAEPVQLPAQPVSKALWAQTVLEAHRILIEADERNEPRFKDLLDFLREDLGRVLPATPAVRPKRRPALWRH